MTQKKTVLNDKNNDKSKKSLFVNNGAALAKIPSEKTGDYDEEKTEKPVFFKRMLASLTGKNREEQRAENKNEETKENDKKAFNEKGEFFGQYMLNRQKTETPAIIGDLNKLVRATTYSSALSFSNRELYEMRRSFAAKERVAKRVDDEEKRELLTDKVRVEAWEKQNMVSKWLYRKAKNEVLNPYMEKKLDVMETKRVLEREMHNLHHKEFKVNRRHMESKPEKGFFAKLFNRFNDALNSEEINVSESNDSEKAFL